MVILCSLVDVFCVFFFKEKTAYEMRISDWSSDVCSSDLGSFFCSSPPKSGVRAFLPDRTHRRDLAGPARPAGLRGKCPPASACGECLLLDFAPKACRPRRNVDRRLA